MKKILAILIITFASTAALSQEQVIWKIVLSSGTVLDFEYFNLEACQTNLKSWSNATCVVFPKSN